MRVSSTCLAYWMKINMINLVMCTIEMKDVQLKYFSTDDEITLKCKCQASYWSGPAIESEKKHISHFDTTDMYGKPRRWNISFYTKRDTFIDTLPQNLFHRMNLTGDNLDLQIKHLSPTDEGLYLCDASNCSMPQTLYLLQYKYKPSIKINVNGSFTVVEGEMAPICCISMSIPKPTSISWYKEEKELVTEYNESSLCYKISNVSRYDTGNYTCCSENEIGNASSEILLIVSYPPVVNIRYSNLTEYSKNRNIQCLPQGEPSIYDFFAWEHRSLFDEHIRYLNGTKDGILQLPEVDLSIRYQDTGFYICNVSNGIPDYRGNDFQLGRTYLTSEGPPVFGADNKRIKDSHKESTDEIRINVYSASEIKCHNITEVDSMSVISSNIEVEINYVLVKKSFHGAIITVNSTEVIFVLHGLNSSRFRKFNVTLCNSYGHNSLVVESNPLVPIESSHQTTQPTLIIVITAILILILAPIFLKCIFFIKGRNKDGTVEEESEVIEGLSESVENRFYQSVHQGESSVSHTSQHQMMDDATLPVSNARQHSQLQSREAMESQLNYADVVFQQSSSTNEESQLNYADVVFQQSSSTNEVRILGLEDRIHYADVDVSARTAFIPDTSSLGDGSNVGSERSSSEDDFVYVGHMANYIQNQPTNI